MEYSEEPGALYHIKYRVAGGSRYLDYYYFFADPGYFPLKARLFLIFFKIHHRDDFLTIATTRPETLFGDTAIAVNPEVTFLCSDIYHQKV